ncbi:MAG TPA: HNH endonuclease, partial [Polyangiaceae bacterium]
EYFRVYRRDAFRCSSPVCRRRDVTPHHLVFRSHGGGDEDDNVASLCSWCHLHGVHEGRIGAEPPASRIRWRIGRSGTLRIDGRALALG